MHVLAGPDEDMLRKDVGRGMWIKEFLISTGISTPKSDSCFVSQNCFSVGIVGKARFFQHASDRNAGASFLSKTRANAYHQASRQDLWSLNKRPFGTGQKRYAGWKCLNLGVL